MQAELLLQEATAATTQLYAALRSGNHHANPPPPRASAAAHAPMDQARLLMHLLGSCVEFGVKEDWRHVLGGRPTARESSFVAARAVQLAAPSPAAMLQVQPLALALACAVHVPQFVRVWCPVARARTRARRSADA